MKKEKTGFSERLKKLLSDAKVSQHRLAKALGISTPSVNAWVKGDAEPTIANLIRLADFFGVEIDQMIRCAPTPLFPTPIGMDEPLNYDIVQVGEKRFWKIDDEPAYTLSKTMEETYGKAWKEAVHYAVCQNILDGVVICVNNHGKGTAEIIGATCGYA